MKEVLFIGVSRYNFKDKESIACLQVKFEGLSQGIKPYVVARGRPFYKRAWGADFYLLRFRFFFWLSAFLISFYLCLTKKIDVIVAQSPLMEGFVGAILKKVLRKELIVETHGDWWEGPFLSRKRRFEIAQRKLAPFLAKFSLKNADKIRAVAQYLADEAKKTAPQKPYFIFPTFTDLDLFLREAESGTDKFILFAGQLEKVKGVEYLIEAFAELANDFPDFKLIIAGDGSELSNLRLQVSNFKLQEKVEFKGRLSLRETKDIMKKCRCLVLPSLSEGLPRVLLEAMALGKPVVGSAVGGIPELIKDRENGFLFEKGNVDDLAKKLKILLADKDLAVEMGRIGRSFVRENFSNEKYTENYLKMLL